MENLIVLLVIQITRGQHRLPGKADIHWKPQFWRFYLKVNESSRNPTFGWYRQDFSPEKVNSQRVIFELQALHVHSRAADGILNNPVAAHCGRGSQYFNSEEPDTIYNISFYGFLDNYLFKLGFPHLQLSRVFRTRWYNWILCWIFYSDLYSR